MDFRVTCILIMEALLAFFLLARSGVLTSFESKAVAVVLLFAAFFVRFLSLDYVTLDYANFLSHWVQHFRDSGIVAGLAQPVGNYNIPYLYFLALFSLSSINDLYLIKLLSILFDVILAYAAMQLLSLVNKNCSARLACFFVVLMLPTVVLNGALWGQCDSIYVALAVLSIYLALSDRPSGSMICMALSFSIKLQAVFIMPVLAVLWMQKKYKLGHFLIFPCAYVLIVLPAVLCGRPFWDTITLYFDQTGSIGSGLNYNSSSVFALFDNVQNQDLASNLGVFAAFGFMAVVLLICFIKRKDLNNSAVLAASVLFAVGIPFFLPHMHDRYFFAIDILSVVLAFSSWKYSLAAPLSQFASLLGYHAYLKTRYFLPMRYGAYALIIVILLGFVAFFCSFDALSKKSKKALDKY